MKTLITKVLAPTLCGLGLTLALATGSAGCSDKASCDKVVDHTLTIMPKEFADAAKKDRDGMLKKCEELSEDARKCALEAKTMQDLGACNQKK